MRFESFKLGAKCWLQSLNQCLSPHPWPACWSMTLRDPDTTGHTYIQEPTHPIRRDCPLCAHSESSGARSEHVVKKGAPWDSCPRVLPSVSPGCAQCWPESLRGAGGSVQAVGTCALWPGCRIVSWAARARGGREPRTGPVLQSCSDCCLSHTSCLSSG